MNIVNKGLLYLLLLPKSLYRQMGINLPHLHAILTAKLIMDDRRPSSIQQTQRRSQDKPVKGATVITMLFAVFMGLFFLISFIAGHDYVTKLTIYFSFYIFILSSTLIADFTSVLIDVRDNTIILPKPVNDKTFVLARLLHIIIHVSKLVLPMTIPGISMIGIQQGAMAIIPFVFMIIAATLFAIFLINALYIFILKVTTPERFKTIISYFQIFFAVAFYGGYQLVPRLINKAALENFRINGTYWAWLLPPYWFAGSWQFLCHFEFTFHLVTCFVLSILVPVMSIWLVINYFAPSFNQKLALISGSGDGGPVATTANTKGFRTTTPRYLEKVGGWLTQKGAERMAFFHTWKLTGRSRDFKMKVYPAFGYIIVYAVIIFINAKKLSIEDIRDQTGTGKFIFLGIIYFSSFILITALQQLVYSDKYKASWIYYTTPVTKPGRLVSGALKAIVVKFYLPVFIVTVTAGIAIVGWAIIPNLLLGMLNLLLIVSVIAYTSIKGLPFSEQQSGSSGSGTFLRGLFMLLIPGSIALLHYMIYSYMPVVLISCVLSGIASWLVADAVREKTWSQLSAGFRE